MNIQKLNKVINFKMTKINKVAKNRSKNIAMKLFKKIKKLKQQLFF